MSADSDNKPKAAANNSTGGAYDYASASDSGRSFGHGRRKHTVRPHLPSDAETTSAFHSYTDVANYRHRRMERVRTHGIRIALLTLVTLIIIIGAGAGIYIANINARLTQNVTKELRDQLAVSEPDEPFYLLLLGVDKDQGRVEDTENYGSSENAYRSDSIMLCRIDPKNVKVTMVSIHRDTVVNMDQYGQQKINASYAFGGPAYTTKVVSTFADVPISHYAEVDLDRFISIVDQVGGVTVDLPVPVYDPAYTGLDLPQGVQTLNGHDAALLCRCRHGYDQFGDGDRYRAANQRMVFTEIIKKVLKSDPAKMAALITTMADSVTTDMDLAFILDLANQMKNLDTSKDIMTGMEPTEGVLLNGGWYEKCIVSKWRKMMIRVHKGLPPYDEEEGERDSTAGVAGAVGEEGERAAEQAREAGDVQEYSRENATTVNDDEGEEVWVEPEVNISTNTDTDYVEYNYNNYVTPTYVAPAPTPAPTYDDYAPDYYGGGGGGGNMYDDGGDGGNAGADAGYGDYDYGDDSYGGGGEGGGEDYTGVEY